MAAQDRAQPFVLLGYRAVHASLSLDPKLLSLRIVRFLCVFRLTMNFPSRLVAQ